jgi:cell division protein FtsB
VAALKPELESLKQQITTRDGEVAVLKRENSTMKSETATLKQESAGLESEAAVLKAANPKLAAGYDALKRQLAEPSALNPELESLKRQNAGLTSENSAERARLRERDAKIAALEAEGASLRRVAAPPSVTSAPSVAEATPAPKRPPAGAEASPHRAPAAPPPLKVGVVLFVLTDGTRKSSGRGGRVDEGDVAGALGRPEEGEVHRCRSRNHCDRAGRTEELPGARERGNPAWLQNDRLVGLQRVQRSLGRDRPGLLTVDWPRILRNPARSSASRSPLAART